MREYGTVASRFWTRGSGLLAKDEPSHWTDADGVKRRTPQIIGRLRCGKCPGHKALREFVVARAGYRCEACGEDTIHLLVADHIISRSNGGSHHPNNMQCLCWSCNSRKTGLIDSKNILKAE